MKKLFIALVAIAMVVFLLVGGIIGLLAYFALTAEPYSLEFTLTEEDYSDFEEAAADFKADVLNDASEFKIALSSQRFLMTYQWIDTQSTVAYINYCKDIKNEEAIKNYEFARGMAFDASNLYNETLKSILNSDNEYVELIFADWDEEMKEWLLNNDSEIYELLEKNSDIVLDYHALDDNDENYENWIASADALYVELVKNYNEVAKKYGYTDYYEYASSFVYTRDYGREDRMRFREYVKSYVIPLYRESAARLTALTEGLTEEQLAEYKRLTRGSFTENEDLRGLVYDYIDGFDPTVEDSMSRMFDLESTLFVNGENAMESAYTTYLSYYLEPIAYFGPGYQDMFTVVHENGHYAAFFGSLGASSSLDVCEVQSQANEWLYIAYLEDKVDPELYDLLVLRRLVRGFETLILATSVDECEESIYKAEGELTHERIAEIVSAVTLTYGEDLQEKLKLERYFRRVVFDSPVYYLSYATSELASIGLYTVADDDLDGARDAYENIQDPLNLVLPFKECLDKCGFLDPFSAETFSFIVDTFQIDDAPGGTEDGGDEGDESALLGVFAELLAA